MSDNANAIETKFKSLGERLDHLIDAAGTAADGANGELHLAMAELKVKRLKVQLQLDELRASGGEKWGMLKEGLEAAYKDLEGAFEKMSA